MFPGSGVGGGDGSARLIVFGLLAFAVLLWEIFYHHNGRRWPVWALAFPTVACFYLAVRGDAADRSWYWMTFLLSTTGGFLVWAIFWADEHARGRR